MKLVVFGLSVSSSWGNGHATLWRSLARGMAQLGHSLTFFERDVPYYSSHRDLIELPAGRLVIYREWEHIAKLALTELDSADAGIVTSYCPDANRATELLLDSAVGIRAFYDLDTPVTLARLDAGEAVDYLPQVGLGAFDVVLSFAGGTALQRLEKELGARRAVPLYGSVDPGTHCPVGVQTRFAASLSYLGTYSADRQDALRALLLEPAAQLPEHRFLLAGSLYPGDFPWTRNLFYHPHVAPPEHPAFYCSSPLTLNVTRAPMVSSGWCPSGRLFEAAACGTPVLSDDWPGIADFFEPNKEILLAHSPAEAIEWISRPASELKQIGDAARRRVLAEHDGRTRSQHLIDLLADNIGVHRRVSGTNVVTPHFASEANRCGE